MPINFYPKFCQYKILEMLYQYFDDLANQANEDEYDLRVRRDLLILNKKAIKSNLITFFFDVWNSEHPEEDFMTNKELLWGLEMLDEHITRQLRVIQLQLIAASGPKARLRVINGGRSKILQLHM